MSGQVAQIERESSVLAPGLYMIGIIRGIVKREVTSRKTGEIMVFESVAVEGDDYNIRRFELTKAQKQAGWVESLAKFEGRKCMIPVMVFKDGGGYIKELLRGVDLPRPVK